MRGKKEKLLGRGFPPAGQWQLSAAQGVSAMILNQTLPQGKTFFSLVGLPARYALHATRFLLACLLGGARLSCAEAAGTVRTAPVTAAP